MSTRFIPACAGNRPACCLPQAVLSVHPRVCGEQPPLLRLHGEHDGSSPRVRGTVHLAVAPVLEPRFIPACAGNSARSSQSAPMASVHPRVCGEQGSTWWQRAWCLGSSPRVRGTVAPVQRIGSLIRFIPACAGNRWRSPTHRSRPAVHPRVCGEQALGAHQRISGYGSSPRVRGTVFDYARDGFSIRFIPACAGNRVLARFGVLDVSVHPRVCGEQ